MSISAIDRVPSQNYVVYCTNFYITAMANETAQLFDMMFKHILKEASSPAVVHFINGLFDKSYKPNSKVAFYKTPDIVTLKIKYPKGEFSYKIPTFKVLEKPVSEFGKKRLDLLLPFYLLKFRRELQKKSVGSEKRKDIANQMTALISDIDRILERHSRENLISREDVSLLVSELSRMHSEIYGNYEEFKEVNMTLMEKVKTHHKEFEKRGEKRGIKLGEERGEKRGKRLGAIEVLNLVKQGYKPSEIEKMVLT